MGGEHGWVRAALAVGAVVFLVGFAAGVLVKMLARAL